MHFFKVFSVLSIAITSAVAATTPLERRYPVPVAAAQPQPASVAHYPVKRDNTTSPLVGEIEAAVPKIQSLLSNSNLDLAKLDLGNIGNIVNEIKAALNGSFLTNAISVVNNGAVLLGGNAPKIGNQLLTSKVVDDLGKQSTYDTLLPLLKNAKPLLSKEFITNTVNLVNNIAALLNGVQGALKELGL